MIVDTSQYNFEESLSRIDQMLNLQTVEIEPLVSIPVLNEIPTKGGVIANCSIMQVEIITPPSREYGALLRVYRAFLSEAVAIVASHTHCVDVMIIGSRLTAAFSTPFKNNIQSLIDKTAMVNTLAQVISKKATGMGLPSITVRIGVDFGEAMLMRFGKYDANEQHPSGLAWMGNPVKKTAELIEKPNHDMNIWISGVIYQNLSDDYKKFFHHDEEFGDYGADIINTNMKSWINKQ